MPTTVFLIAACWCFARSIPRLEQVLVRSPIFRPFLHALDGDGGMPLRAKVWSLALMWAGIAGAATWMTMSERSPWLIGTVLAAGRLGTYWITRRIQTCVTHANHATCSQSQPQSATQITVSAVELRTRLVKPTSIVHSAHEERTSSESRSTGRSTTASTG